MKKLFIAGIAAGILSLTSCSNAVNSYLGGSWTYKGVSYTAITAGGSTHASSLLATGGSTSEVDNVEFKFTSYPPAPGTYTIVNTPPTAGQVYVVMTLGTKAYTVANSGVTSLTVSANGSKIGIIVPAVDFSNIYVQAADAGSFTATITQNI